LKSPLTGNEPQALPEKASQEHRLCAITYWRSHGGSICCGAVLWSFGIFSGLFFAFWIRLSAGQL